MHFYDGQKKNIMELKNNQLSHSQLHRRSMQLQQVEHVRRLVENILKHIGCDQRDGTILLCDNNSEIKLSKNPLF